MSIFHTIKKRHLLAIAALLTIIILTPLAVYIARTPKEAEASWYSGGTGTWTFRKKLVIDHTKVGDGADLTNYPVLLARTFPELKDHAQADGDDIMFTSSDGTTQLDHEIDYYDPTTGQVYFWIEIPTLYQTTDTTIYMYYGNPNASTQEDQAGTWGDSRFSGVYHLSETPVEGVSSILDSDSDSASDCTPIDFATTDPDWESGNLVNSPAYKGLEFASSASQELYLDCGDTAEFDVGTGDFSLLVRWNLPVGETANMSIIDKTNASLGGTYTGWVWAGRLDFNGDAQLRVQDGDGTESYVGGTTNLDTGSWISLTVSADRDGTSYSYFNGSQDGSSSITGEAGSLDNAEPLKIGKNFSNNPRLEGILDEVWIIKGEAVSSGFAATFHNNLSDPATFFKYYGSPEQKVEPILYWKMDEGSGTSINDSTPSQNHGTSSGATWETSPSNCITTNCLSFDGSNDVVTIATANDADVDFATTETFSGSAWVYVTSMPTSTASDKDLIMGKWDDNSNQATYRMYVENDDTDSTGNIEVQIYDESASQAITATGTTDSIVLNTWYHVAFTFNGGTAGAAGDLKLYVNGLYSAQNAQNTSFLGLEDKASDFTVGDYDTNDATSGNTAFAGRIDEVKVYDDLRSDAEIKTDYLIGASDRGSEITVGIGGTTMPNPNIWWRFDEGSGTTANNAGSNGSGDNGTITSGSWTPSGKYDKALTFTASTSVSDTITDPGYTHSISLWVYPTTSAASKTLVTSGKLSTDSSSRPTYGTCTGTALSLNTWTHIVAVSNGSGSCAIYQNGEATSTNTTGVTFGSSFNVGGTSFTGTIDDVKYYNVALTADQAAVDYNADSSLMAGNATNEKASLSDGDYSSSLIGYWPFDENTGSVGYDKSVNTYDFTLASASDWIPAKFGSGVTFDGSSDYATSTSENGSLSISTYSVSTWFNRLTDSGGAENLVDNRDSANDGWRIYIDASDQVICRHNNTGTTTSSAISLNTWYHAMCVADGSSLKLYLNGNIEFTNGAVSGTITESTDLRLAASSFDASEKFAGILDEVKVFSSALTPAQVAYEYSRGLPIAWLRFDECSGTTLNNAIGTTAYNATWTGATGTNTSLGNCGSGTSSHAWYNGAAGKFGSSLDFDGGDDIVTIPNSSSLDLNEGLANGFTISAWIYPDSDGEGGAGYILGKGTNNYCKVGGESGGNVTISCRVNLATDAEFSATTTIPTGQWSHFALSWTDDGDDEITIWINGVAHTSSSIYAGATAGENSSLYIGNDTGQANTFDGKIDEVRVYNYELSAQQVKSLMNNGSINF